MTLTPLRLFLLTLYTTLWGIKHEIWMWFIPFKFNGVCPHYEILKMDEGPCEQTTLRQPADEISPAG